MWHRFKLHFWDRDFLCENVRTLEYEKQQLATNTGKINLYYGDTATRVCRITVKDKYTVQANSCAWVPVQVENKQCLAQNRDY